VVLQLDVDLGVPGDGPKKVHHGCLGILTSYLLSCNMWALK
jgi:hypothetical protein